MLPKVDECVSPKAASGTSPGGSILPLFFSKIQTSEELAKSSFQFGLDWKNSSFVDWLDCPVKLCIRSKDSFSEVPVVHPNFSFCVVSIRLFAKNNMGLRRSPLISPLVP